MTSERKYEISSVMESKMFGEKIIEITSSLREFIFGILHLFSIVKISKCVFIANQATDFHEL